MSQKREESAVTVPRHGCGTRVPPLSHGDSSATLGLLSHTLRYTRITEILWLIYIHLLSCNKFFYLENLSVESNVACLLGHFIYHTVLFSFLLSN